jgi:hypothetical protein
MTKSKTLWLVREKDEGGLPDDYILRTCKPDCDCGSLIWLDDNSYVLSVGQYAFHKLFPALKLRPGQCVEVKLTMLKNGFKLERVK